MDSTLLDITQWNALSADAKHDLMKQVLPAGWTADGDTAVHTQTGWRFRVVPGGTVELGASGAEREALEGLIGDLSPEEADMVPMVLEELPEVRRVELRPFLLATVPLTEAVAKLFGKLVMVPDGLDLTDVEAAQQALTSMGMRLPSTDEWEHAYRAGSQTPFPWGVTPPESPWLPPGALGLEYMAVSPELCQDGEALHAKGGAAIVFPWQGCGEWLTLLSAYTSSVAQHDNWLAVRPCVPLG